MAKNPRHIIVTIAIILFAQNALGQMVFEQGIVQGGITAAGFSTGMGSGSGSFDIFIEPGSTIKKAYIFSYTLVNPPIVSIELNGAQLDFSPSNVLMNVSHSNPWASPVKLYYREITNEIVPEDIAYNVTIPLQPNLPINEGFWTLFLIVVYENELLSNTAYTIAINDKDLIGNEEYSLSELNPIETTKPFGFSLYTDRSGVFGEGTPNFHVEVNEQYLGFAGGSDQNSTSWGVSGVKGHFYYQNNQLFGLNDDVANDSMNGSDALADISTYINNLNTEFSFELKHMFYPNQDPAATNINLAYTLAYTTPCQPFETTLIEEVETCRGDTAQLLATGGINYEWLPQEGLSCYNCPNPVFMGDSSKVYAVRIWNTDSCSKVLPVKVNVLDVPESASLATTAATCSENNGTLDIQSVSGGQSPYQFNVGGNWVTNPTAFDSLDAGDYTLTIRDQNECYYQQYFSIAAENPAHAAFTANPQSGIEPLDVDFINQSNGTTHYNWSLAGNTFSTVDTSYTFDSAGSYPIQLISWYNEPHCADTAMATIIVNPAPPDYSHSIFMPTLHNPQNGDFLIETTNVQRVEFALYNTIGQHILSTERDVNDGVNGLFNGSRLARGYYFYRLKYWDVQGLEYKERGKVLLMR